MPKGGRRPSPDPQDARNTQQSTPHSPISSQSQAAHMQWRESRTSSSQSHSSSSSVHYHHPSHHHPSRPPSSSSSSGSAAGYESRYGPPHLAPPPLAPYVTPNRRFFAPLPAQEQWLGLDGRRLTSHEPRPGFPPLQRPRPDHILAASGSRMTPSLPPPIQPPPTAHPYPSLTPPSSEELTQHLTLAGGQTPTAMHFSMLSTHDYSQSHPSPSTVVGPKGYMEEQGKGSHSRVTGWQQPSSSRGKLPMRSRSRSSSSAGSGSTSRGSQRSGHEGGVRRASRTSSSPSQVEGYRRTSRNPSREGSARAASVGVEHRRGKKKRTRALMTHAQQAGLMSLWKKTKFPTSGDREVLGQQIGLTARQVQVWFQNQRQKGRKTLLVNGGVPEGEDPADYEDLQKSPRSRRLSIEKDERIFAWAGTSAGGSAWTGADGHAPEAVTPAYDGTGYPYLPAMTSEPQYRHVPTHTNPFPVPQHTRSAPLPPTSAVSWSPSSQYPSVLEPPRSSNSLPSGELAYAPSRSGFADPAPSSWAGYYPYEQYGRGYTGHSSVQGSLPTAHVHDTPSRRSVVEDHHPNPATLPAPPSSFPLASYGSGHAAPPPPILSAPITTPTLSHSTRQRADTRSSVQSVPSSSSTTSTPASTSHLPPSLARIAIAGPVAGGDDLPSLLPGIVGGREGEEIGSPRKRNASWTLPERRVKGRGPGEEEGSSSGVRKLLD
ncbi:hypothetical protein IAR50_006016 [Cryptococcus sp. DSM 104548]